jgi:hypothetical protein
LTNEFNITNEEKIMNNKLNILLICLLGFCLTGTASTKPQVQKGKVLKAKTSVIQNKKPVLVSPPKVATPEPSRSTAPETHFLAEIRLFAGNFEPRGWRFCEGQILTVNDNLELFSLLGTTYGGDGRTSFALPDLRQAEIPFRSNPNRPNSGCRYIISTSGSFPSRP